MAITLHQGKGPHHDTGKPGSRGTDPAPQCHWPGEFNSRPHHQRMGIRSKMMEHAKLVVHTGGVRVTREDLVQCETPAATATWRPVPHHVLVHDLHAEVARRHLAVVTEEYA